MDVNRQRERLGAQLTKAVEAENYEEAAQIRDQIKELEAAEEA